MTRQRQLERAVFELIELAKSQGLNGHAAVEAAKELIRCRVLGCGLTGACDGSGVGQYTCPLRDIRL